MVKACGTPGMDMAMPCIWGSLTRQEKDCKSGLDVYKRQTEYPVVIAPAYQLADKELVNKWIAYVKNGGNLVLTCRTDVYKRQLPDSLRVCRGYVRWRRNYDAG